MSAAKKGSFRPRKLKRAPVKNLDDACVALLGSALEVELSGVVLRFDEIEAPFFWHPETKSVLWIDAPCRKLKAKQLSEKRTLQAKIDYEEWADRKSTKWESWRCSVSKSSHWYSCGKARRFDYKSDKWNKKQEYTHELGKGVCLYFLGSSSMQKGLWLLRGGKLRVTSRGIEG